MRRSNLKINNSVINRACCNNSIDLNIMRIVNRNRCINLNY